MITITYASLAAEAVTKFHADHERAKRAVAIAAQPGNIYGALKAGTGWSNDTRRSETVYDVRGSAGWYTVDTVAKTCTCADSTRGHICKHRLAVWLYRQVIERNLAQVKRPATNRGAHSAQILAELGY